MMVAFPCSTFSVSRLFDATKSGNADRGPPPVRSKAHPDGLPSDRLDAKHAKELGVANELLDRTVEIILAAYRSPRRTTIVLENPADRSIMGTAQYASDMRDHGSLWATSPFRRLKDAIPLSSTCTFAMCKFNGGVAQKYTTLWFTNDAAKVLSQLDGPEYKCDHDSHERWVGGQKVDGQWSSKSFAAYPKLLNVRLAMAFNLARTGDPRSIKLPVSVAPAKTRAGIEEIGEAPPAPDDGTPLVQTAPTVAADLPSTVTDGASSTPVVRDSARSRADPPDPLSERAEPRILGDRDPGRLAGATCGRRRFNSDRPPPHQPYPCTNTHPSRQPTTTTLSPQSKERCYSPPLEMPFSRTGAKSSQGWGQGYRVGSGQFLCAAQGQGAR